jgi:DNA modification methylase
MSQSAFNLLPKAVGLVECLGQTFASEDARREHYLNLLAQKLKDPEFHKIEGFPIGKDEDILALSDPPYYTACPNPWLGEFIKCYGTPYDQKQPYHREPFATDVSEGKTHPIYNAHTYHTKVPHRAIMRYLLHYTEPGDIVFDGFAGTGMTGVAAQLCGSRAEVQELGYRVQQDGTIVSEDGKHFSKVGPRRTILNDLSPAASFIAYNYNVPAKLDAFELEARRLLKEIEDELGWMYETKHSDGKTKGRINFTVWSDVFSCPECAGEVVFWDEAVDEGEIKDEIQCPHCQALLTKRNLDRKTATQIDLVTNAPMTKAKRKPVLINYFVGGSRYEKAPDGNDLALIDRIEKIPCKAWYPTNKLEQDTDLWMERDYRSLGIFTIDAFFSKRNLLMAAFCREAIMRREGRVRGILWFWFQSVLMGFSLVNRYLKNAFSQVNRILSGTLYVGAMQSEVSPWYSLNGKVKRLAVLSAIQHYSSILGTGSTVLVQCPSNSVDYIFIDPPFGSNIIYSDLSLIWESWLRLSTRLDSEAVVHRRKQKGSLSLSGYSELMRRCFREFYRILKPGHWMTIEFSNTRASVWNAIQTALQEAGFVVANVAALDKQMGSFKAVTTTTAVKQDLIISAYKPNGGLEARFAKRGETEEGAWDFLRAHLKNLPIVKAKGGQLELIAERDPRILYDRMVAFYVGHSTPVPLSSAEFQAGLAEKFPERDGMYFLPEQVNEYDKKRALIENIGQLTIFVEDERSAINWLRNFLKDRPSTYQDIQPHFMQQLGASWKKWEARPELSALLDQNFLCYDATGDVPSQVHSYLSTQFKELRNLPKDHTQLKAKAKSRWYVPDPKKNVDVETLRNKRLLEEFWSYLPEGYSPPALSANKGQTLPGLTVPRPKIPKGKKLKELRTEAVRVGFKHCYQQKDYTTILVVAEMLPESVLNEDEQLQMIYDTAVTRTGSEN